MKATLARLALAAILPFTAAQAARAARPACLQRLAAQPIRIDSSTSPPNGTDR